MTGRATDSLLQDRITVLEERIMYQERLLEDLNAIVTEQRRLVEDLTKQLREFARQLRLLSTSETTTEKPPHY